MFCPCCVSHRNYTDRRKEYQPKRGGAPVQRTVQNLALPPLDELAACLSQVILLPKQNLCYRRRLRHVLRSLWHPREQVELHFVLQLPSWKLPLLFLFLHRHHRRWVSKFSFWRRQSVKTVSPSYNRDPLGLFPCMQSSPTRFAFINFKHIQNISIKFALNHRFFQYMSID